MPPDVPPVTAEAFLEREAFENPVPSLEDAVKVAEAGRTRKVIEDRKARTHAILSGQSFEAPTRAETMDPLPSHLFQERAKGMR